jgi:hypothetical protein
MKTAVCQALLLMLAFPAFGKADLEEWDVSSIEWVVDSSDAIAIGEVISHASEDESKHSFRVVEILKPHESLSVGQTYEAGKSWRGEEGDQGVLYFSDDENGLTCSGGGTFVDPLQMKYCIYGSCPESEMRNYQGIDSRGVFLETPEALIQAIRDRLAVSDGFPEGFDASPGSEDMKKCWMSPRGYEYDCGSHDVIMQIRVPPDIMEEINRERSTVGEFPRPVSTKEREAIFVAEQLHDRDIFHFVHGGEADMPFVDVYQISPLGKYLLGQKEGRLIVIDVNMETVVWEDVLLTSIGEYVQFAANETIIAYAVRGNGFKVVDIRSSKLYPVISTGLGEKRVQESHSNITKCEIDPSGKYVTVQLKWASFYNPTRYAVYVFEVESRRMLTSVEDSPYVQHWPPFGTAWEGAFSPNSSYLVFPANNTTYVLWDWRNNLEAARIPIENDVIAAPPLIAPDEQTVAVPYRKRGSGSLNRFYDYTHVQFWNVESGEMLCETPVPENTDTLKFLDGESMLVIPRDDDYVDREAIVLRWDEPNEGEASVFYREWRQ